MPTKNRSLTADGFRLTLRGLPYILVGMLRARKNSKRRATRLRDPERTRERLLQAAYREVYRTGFQSAGLDTILASTGVTKGALYYHFKSKEALGYAIVEEIVEEITRDRWVRPLQRSKDKDAIDALIGIVRAIPARPKDVKGGCPLVNLAQEMSPLDEQFRERLERIFQCLARRNCRGFPEGAVSGNGPPRLGSGRDCELSDRAGRRLRSVGKECSRREGVEYGNQKYRGLAKISSPAGQPASEADRIASKVMSATYQPVCMLGQFASQLPKHASPNQIERSVSRYLTKKENE